MVTNTVPKIHTQICFFLQVIFSCDKILVTRQLLIDTKISVQQLVWKVMISHNVKDAVETAIMNIIENVVSNDIEKERQKKRVRQENLYYWDSTWGRILLDPTLADSDSFAAKKFRRRIRVLYPLFSDVIVPLCRQYGILTIQRERIPLELKVLSALHILGRDYCSDSISELSFIGESTVNAIFKAFLKQYSEALYDLYVRPPEGEELLVVMERYRRLGFPGAFGSVDCTHVKWSMFFKDDRWLALGKVGYPTLSFEVVVPHSKYCYHCSSYNDITIAKNVKFILELLTGKYSEVPYIL